MLILAGWLMACGPADTPEVAAPPATTEPAPTQAATRSAAERAADWMIAWPGEPRFDAAIAAHEAWRAWGGEPWATLRERRITGVRDPDHEHRRFFDPDARLPAERVHGWSAPTDGSRINPNRVVTEALYCAEAGWRPETEAYACGAMRDGGGYHTTHALWALSVARANGCSEAPCANDLVAELVAAQPDPLTAARSLDVDLYAERLLMSCMVGCPAASDRWARRLLDAQLPDGSWGVSGADEDPYHRYHATMMSAWALGLWSRERAR